MSQDSTKNVELYVSEDGKTLNIAVDLTKNYGLTTAGRSELVANCHWLDVPDHPEFSLVLTLVKRQPRQPRRRVDYYGDEEGYP